MAEASNDDKTKSTIQSEAYVAEMLTPVITSATGLVNPNNLPRPSLQYLHLTDRIYGDDDLPDPDLIALPSNPPPAQQQMQLNQAVGIQVNEDEEDEEEIRQLQVENKKMKAFVICRKCNEGESQILFIPCGCIKYCVDCSVNETFCPTHDDSMNKMKIYRA